MSDNTFEVAGGNGRLYKLDAEKAAEEQERLRALREDKGYKWATPESAHSYEGFLQISQEYINWLQEGLNMSGTPTVRMNWKAHIAKMQSGLPCMHIKGNWFGDKNMPKLKDFIDGGAKVTTGGGQAPAPAQGSPAPQAAGFEFEDDDVPF
jgi:hypothetical protein|tara:strand:- start:2815 stop:3267 length:453 start_codon:yes stop_codon:yes gene_type:complete